MKAKLESFLQPFWLKLLLLLAIVVFGFISKFHVPAHPPVDFDGYENKVNSLRLGYSLQTPVSIYVLYGIHLLLATDLLVAFQVCTALFSMLIAFPVYWLSWKLTHSATLSLVSSVIAVFMQPIAFVLFGYWKNIFGLFILACTLPFLYDAEKNKWGFAGFLFLEVTLLFTYDLAFLFSIIIAGAYAIFGLRKKLALFLTSSCVLISWLLLATPMVTSLSSYWGRIHIRLGTFTFNYPRFMEAFMNFQVAMSLAVFFGSILTFRKQLRVNKETQFVASLGIVGLSTHLLSFITPLTFGLRFMYQSYLPFSICLPYLLSRNRDSWFLWAVVLMFVLPSLGYFLFRLTGGWI